MGSYSFRIGKISPILSFLKSVLSKIPDGFTELFTVAEEFAKTNSKGVY